MPHSLYRRAFLFLFCSCCLIVFNQTATAAGKKYALVVGVERSTPSPLKSRQYAEEDAIGLSKALTQLGFDVVTMTRQAERPDHVPTSADDILSQIERCVRNRVADDTIIVALSGHGVQLKNDRVRADGTKESYFCPERADLRQKSSLVAMSDVVSAMQQCEAGRKLLLVDACRNEVEPQERSCKDASLVELELAPAGVTRRTIPNGMLALFSCSRKERSVELSSLKHSVFTHKILQYLNGKAPSTQYPRGQLRIGELASYVTRETHDLIDRRLSVDQNPELVLPGGRLIDWELGSLELTNSIGMQFKLIPAGEFLMGSPASEEHRFKSEGPQHQVRISRAFRFGLTEVTQQQWFAVMKTKPWADQDYVKEGDRYAATYISWNDAVEFCKRLSQQEGQTYRLPSEAEWEYACRAGTTTAFSFGNSEARLSEYAWWGGYGGMGSTKDEEYAHEVQSLKPNKFGLHDMHGNVSEWCSDWWDLAAYSPSAQTDPVGPGTGPYRASRGGSWFRHAKYVRSARRAGNTPDNRSCVVGFRVVVE